VGQWGFSGAVAGGGWWGCGLGEDGRGCFWGV
jgi:hypothetical protein